MNNIYKIRLLLKSKKLISTKNKLTITFIALFLINSLNFISIKTSSAYIKGYNCTDVSQNSTSESARNSLKKQLKEETVINLLNVSKFITAHLDNSGLLDLSDTNIEKIDKKAFELKNDIKIVVFPETLKTIEGRAFFGCENLRKLTLPASLKNIGNAAFSCCFNLEELKFDKPLELDYKGTGIFFNCYKLNTIYLENNLRESLKNKKNRCKENFKIITVLDRQNLENFIFAYSDDNGVIDLSDTSIKKILKRTFKSNKDIRKIVLPETLQEIEDSAFKHCKNLNEVDFSKCINLKKIGDKAFFGSALIKINIPKQIKEIRKSTFVGCENLLEVKFAPNSCLNRIHYGAFYNCISLHTLDLSNCNKLKSIDNHAFSWCKKLKNIIWGHKRNISIATDAFDR